jgi:hypothetical protein
LEPEGLEGMLNPKTTTTHDEPDVTSLIQAWKRDDNGGGSRNKMAGLADGNQ